TKVVVNSEAGELDFDLAIDASGAGMPSTIDAGYAPFRDIAAPKSPVALYLLLAAALAIAVPVLLSRTSGGTRRVPPLAGA
ncbi:MAG: hypothetical protein H0W41_07345, partial [Chloroflexi bacterium]|nr:hypothetical protein [Chloroflexota bacterium]